MRDVYYFSALANLIPGLALAKCPLLVPKISTYLYLLGPKREGYSSDSILNIASYR